MHTAIISAPAEDELINEPNMRLSAILAAAASFVVACGPGDTYANEDTHTPAKTPSDNAGIARVATEFAGKWIDRTSRRTMTTAVDANLLSVVGLCADGSGSINVIGRDRVVNWTGDVVCPAPAGSCSAGVLHYSSAILTLRDDSSLDVSGVGYISGCGDATKTPFAFHYVRQ